MTDIGKHGFKSTGRIVLLTITLAGVVGGQSLPDSMSVNDPRPLAKAAEVLMLRYGVPINYEDVSAYAYEGDLIDLATLRVSHPTAKARLPRNGNVTINFTEPQSLANPQNSYSAPKPADPKGVARLLQGILDQHASNGNPGRFKLVETEIGTTIVPTATRNSAGDFVADQSLLDLRISFPEQTDATLALSAFCQALSAASGKSVKLTQGYQALVQIGARNEVARDVLVKLINGMRLYGGLLTADPKSGNAKFGTGTKLAWRLTTEPGIDPPYTATYHLVLGEVIMERPGSGRSTIRTPVWREPVAQDK